MHETIWNLKTLFYYLQEGITEMVDLRLSTVKNAVDVDRRCTFSVVCPTKYVILFFLENNIAEFHFTKPLLNHHTSDGGVIVFRFNFVFFSFSFRCWYLQADNEKSKEHWIKVMQASMIALYVTHTKNSRYCEPLI